MKYTVYWWDDCENSDSCVSKRYCEWWSMNQKHKSEDVSMSE